MLRDHRPRRGELEPPPKSVRKEIVISEASDLAVVFEDGLACEFIMRQGEQLVGDIILGKVESVVPAIEAAFINIGHEKNGFIHVADLPPAPGTKRGKPPTIRSGDRLIVQIAKAPTGTKGARLTGRISVPGRYLVFVPHDNRVCISRRIVDSKERERLRRIAFNLKDPGHGLIVRTEAIGASEEELRRDIDDLIERWAEILHVAQIRHAPALLYRDHDLMTRVLRDAVSADTEKIVIDSNEGLSRAADLLSAWMPDMVKNLHLHNGKDTVMNSYKINAEMETALKPTIRLPSGGSIVIEPTEALTVIDVNSGKLTNSKSLQDTVLRTNLEAATEIARQLRLRDIGGVVIIDFISMDFPADRQKVIRHLEEALRPDKSRPQITTQFSEHGLLELARRRQGQSLLEQLTTPCQHCHGVGRIRNDVLAISTGIGGAIAEVGGDDPEALVEELIEEPLASDMLEAEVEPGAELIVPPRPRFRGREGRDHGPVAPHAAAAAVYGEDVGGGFEEEDADVLEVTGDGDQPRKRRRRRRRRGGRGPEGEESIAIRAEAGSAVGSGLGFAVPGDLDDFEASPEDIAAYAQESPTAEGDAEGVARRRRRRRRGRGGRGGEGDFAPAEGLGLPESREGNGGPGRVEGGPARAGFGRLDRPAERPQGGFGRPAVAQRPGVEAGFGRQTAGRAVGEGFGRREPAEGFGRREPAEGFGRREPAEGLGRREPAEGFGRREPAEGLGRREPGFGRRPEGFGARPERPPIVPEIERVEELPAKRAEIPKSDPVPPAVVAASPPKPETPAPKRLPKGMTGFRPIVGPVEKTAPYTPKVVARPKMEVREVAPGVMQLVPVDGAPATPEAVADVAVKRTRRTAVRKSGSEEAVEIAQAVEAAKAQELPAKPAAVEETKPARKRTPVSKAKPTISRTRKTPGQ